MFVKACVNSGECCRAAPCGFGRWNADKTACEHLAFDKDGLSSCGIYEDVIKDPTSVVSPAYGSGCCRTLFNEQREIIIRERYEGIIPMVEINDF